MSTSTARLRVVTPRTTKPSKARAPRAKRPITSPIKLAGGAVIGGFIPLAAYTLAHQPGLPFASLSTLLVIGGLLYSAPTVYEWAKGFAGGIKAFGFVLLLEGILVVSPVAWLSVASLVILMGVNAAILATKLGKK